MYFTQNHSKNRLRKILSPSFILLIIIVAPTNTTSLSDQHIEYANSQKNQDILGRVNWDSTMSRNESEKTLSTRSDYIQKFHQASLNGEFPLGFQKQSIFPYVANVQNIVVDGITVFVAGSRGGIYIFEWDQQSMKVISRISDGVIAQSIALSNGHLYVADEKKGVIVFDVRDPENPIRVSEYSLGAVNDLKLIDGYLYVTSFDFGMYVLAISETTTLTLVGYYPMYEAPSRLSVYDNELLFIIVSPAGFEVVDISNPESPKMVSRYVGSSGVSSVYDVVRVGEYAFLSTIFHGISILDVSDVSNPKNVTAIATDNAARDLSIYNGYLIVNDGLSDMIAFNISNPLAPVRISTFDESWGYSYKSTINGTNAFLSSNMGVIVVNVSDIASPKLVSNFSFYDLLLSMALDKDLLFISDINHGIVVFNVSDPLDPKFISEYDPGAVQYSKIILDARRKILYASSAYSEIEVLNVTDSNNVSLLVKFGPKYNKANFFVQNDIVYISQSGTGILVFNTTDLNSITQIGTYATTTEDFTSFDVLSEKYAVGAASDVYSFNVTTLSSITSLNQSLVSESVKFAKTVGRYVMVITESEDLYVLDFFAPWSPSIEGRAGTNIIGSDTVTDAVIFHNYFIAGGSQGKLYVFDIANVSAPRLVGIEEVHRKITDILIVNDFLYVSLNEHGIDVLSMDELVKPSITNVHHSPTTIGEKQDVTVFATISDNSGIETTSLYYQKNEGRWNKVEMNATNTPDLYKATIGPFSGNSKVRYYIEATDQSLLRNTAVENNSGNFYSFIVELTDLDPPDFHGQSVSPLNPRENQTIQLTMLISDPSGILSAKIFYRANYSEWNVKTMNQSLSDDNLYYVDIGSFSAGSMVYYYFEATDNSTSQNTGTYLNNGDFFKVVIQEQNTNSSLDQPSNDTLDDSNGLPSKLLLFAIGTITGGIIVGIITLAVKMLKKRKQNS